MSKGTIDSFVAAFICAACIGLLSTPAPVEAQAELGIGLEGNMGFGPGVGARGILAMPLPVAPGGEEPIGQLELSLSSTYSFTASRVGSSDLAARCREVRRELSGSTCRARLSKLSGDLAAGIYAMSDIVVYAGGGAFTGKDSRRVAYTDEFTSFDIADSERRYGINLFTGLRIPAGNVAVFGEARHHLINFRGTTFSVGLFVPLGIGN